MWLVWVAWLIIFALFETIALVDAQRGDTFTENFRSWLRLSTASVQTRGQLIGMWVARVAVITFGFWLTTHMAFGWFGGGEGFLGG